MGKIYTSKEDYEAAMEQEFVQKCQEVAMYQGDIERTTIDGEWTYSELKDDIWEEAHRILQGEKGKKGWIEEHKNRAFKDKDLLHEEFIVEDICNRFDIIEVYNRAYDIHKNDKPRLFGIHYFDDLAKAEILKVLNNNLLT